MKKPVTISDLEVVAREINKIISECDGLVPYMEEIIPKGPSLKSHFNVMGTVWIENPSKIKRQHRINDKYSLFIFTIDEDGIKYMDSISMEDNYDALLDFHFDDPNLFDKIRDVINTQARIYNES